MVFVKINDIIAPIYLLQDPWVEQESQSQPIGDNVPPTYHREECLLYV